MKGVIARDTGGNQGSLAGVLTAWMKLVPSQDGCADPLSPEEANNVMPLLVDLYFLKRSGFSHERSGLFPIRLCLYQGITQFTQSFIFSERRYPKTRRVYWYLEHVLECKVEPEPDGKHHIIFPDGTVEEIYPGQSTLWTYKTTLRFPNGRTLSKYETVNIRDMTTISTLLAFPNTILDGPEPDEE